MTKQYISALVYVHQNDYPVETEDYQAINAWMTGHGATVDVEGTPMYIPYESVMMMTFSHSTDEVDPPEDPLCQPVVCETAEPCDPDDNGGDDTP